MQKENIELMKTVLVTPSWAQDFDRCRMLVDSAGEFAHGFDKHIILIDALDVHLFQPLAGPKVELVLKQDLLPGWLFQTPFSRRWWLSIKALPIRGWIVQQVAKLAIASIYEADSFCYIDSDALFIRPFAAHQLWQNDKVRLYRDERKPHFYQSRRYRNWYGFAANQFNLGDQKDQRGAFIAQLNVIHKQPLLAMLLDIESRWQKPWCETLLRSMDFSEYILYGIYSEHCTDLAHHYVTSESLCHSSWFYDLDSEQTIENFVQTAQPHHVALHIQSNLRVDPKLIQTFLTRTAV